MNHRFLSTSNSVLALFALVGCDQSAPLAPFGESTTAQLTPAAASGLQMVPWKESYEASGTITLDARCPTPLLLVSLEGGGTATHVGKYTIVNSHCVDPSTGALTSGTFIKTAANGDQIFGTYTGSTTIIQPPAPIGIFGVTGTLTFTGGTGRFAGVTGAATMSGSLQSDFSQPTVPTDVMLVMIGSISSVGSTKH
jgi:hypothetical protein